MITRYYDGFYYVIGMKWACSIHAGAWCSRKRIVWPLAIKCHMTSLDHVTPELKRDLWNVQARSFPVVSGDCQPGYSTVFQATVTRFRNKHSQDQDIVKHDNLRTPWLYSVR